LLLVFAFLLFDLIVWLLCFAPFVTALFAKAALLLLALVGASIGAPPNVLVSFSARLRPASIDAAFII